MARIKRRLCYYRYKLNKKTYRNKSNSNIKTKIQAVPAKQYFKKIVFTRYKAISIIRRAGFAQLFLNEQKGELLASRQDVYILKKNLELKNSEPKIFRPWLIKKIWRQMSLRRKQNHLKRKRELFAKGVKFRKLTKKTRLKNPKNRVYFVNAKHRPLIKIMQPLIRAFYLKKIMNKASPRYENKIKGINLFFNNPLQCADLLGKKQNITNIALYRNLKKPLVQNNKLLRNLIIKKRARH